MNETSITDRAVWLEVALNGGAGRAYQPLIPMTPDEIISDGIACAKAGASVIHTHVYDEKGLPCECTDTYLRVFEGIKEQVDIIVYPTVALQGSAEQRYRPLEMLAKRGLLDWGVVDPGSVNIAHTSQVLAKQDGLVYSNPDSHIRYALELASRDKWRPAYAIYEPGFVRLGAAIANTMLKLKEPIYRLMFSNNLLFGAKPTERALEFYVDHIHEHAGDVPWMISGLDANIQDLILPALEKGGHIRVGLEDAPFGSQINNLELVEQAMRHISNAGYTVEAPSD